MREIYRRLAQSPGSSLATLGGLLAVATVALFLTGLEAHCRDRSAVATSDALNFANFLAAVLTFEDIDRALRRVQAADAALRGLQKSSSVVVAIDAAVASTKNVA